MTEYDNDSMGGLMCQILALTAPPGTTGSRETRNGVQNTYNGPSNTLIFGSQIEKTGLAAHPYFRRPGKGHNRDSCDACSEGGDLICCDICPASFHLTCHDPPLEEDNIPVGEWMCHQCRIKKEDEKVTNNRNGKTVKVTKKKEKDSEQESKVWTSGREMVVSATPLTSIVKEAASKNPKQFSLPFEITLPVNFPNEPKDTVKRNGRPRWGRKKPYELDNGLTPRPAILCFQCNKSCRVGPIIPCDYCSLFYHLDCVNPPLTIPPTGKWMCPNHHEHFMDSNLTSHSLVERVKIWDKFSGPLDEQSIKLNFIRKCNKERINSKFQIRKVTRSRVKVPRAVKCQYADPPELMPHLSSSSYVPMPALVKRNGIEAILNASDLISNAENSVRPDRKPELMDSSVQTDESPPYTENIERSNLQEMSHEENEPTLSLNDVKPTEEERKEWLLGLLQFQSDAYSQLSKQACGLPQIVKPTNGVVASLENQKPVVNGDLKLEALIAKSRKRKSSYKNDRNKNHLSNAELLVDTLTSLGDSLKKKIEENNNMKLNRLNQTLLEVLAYERIISILKPEEPKQNSVTMPQIPARALLCPLVQDITLKSMTPLKSYSCEPVAMKFRVLNIGKGSHNHVNLELFGSCNNFSSRHAAIIFDQSTGSYELLNYSEHGTNVDGISLNCNFSDKTVSEAAVPSVLAQLREIADNNRGIRGYRDEEDIPVMNSMPGQTMEYCSCFKRNKNDQKDEVTSRGWEGASLLHHGSFIKFGCVPFVFSLVETAIHGDWAKDVRSVYENFIIKETEIEKCEPSEQKTQLS